MDKEAMTKRLEELKAQRSILLSAMETMQSDILRVNNSIDSLSYKIEHPEHTFVNTYPHSAGRARFVNTGFIEEEPVKPALFQSTEGMTELP